ncbi:S-layer homology domain-containing protein [Paenibacillus agaridevorans]|uniref:S-layer homology domain-containing protein n=1 Tax=Paenibacillus agaridevorans TaxID=171404 RepID=UPI001BE401D6|nr:S-layer homology domain-containing protein [Paenibacillus agaridevorans]
MSRSSKKMVVGFTCMALSLGILVGPVSIAASAESSAPGQPAWNSPLASLEAAASVTVQADVDASTGDIRLSGEISSGQGKKVTIKVMNPSGDIDYVDQSVSGPEGSYSFHYMLNKEEAGSYTVWAGGDGVEEPASTSFTYTPKSPPVVISPGQGSNREGSVSIGNDGIIAGKPKYYVDSKQAVLTITEDDLAQASKNALLNGPGAKVVTIQVEERAGVVQYVHEIPSAAISAGHDELQYKFITGIGTVIVPSHMVKPDDLGDLATVRLVIRESDAAALAPSLKESVGDRPVVVIYLESNGERLNWNNPDAPVTVSIPYEPTEEELSRPDHIVIWYIDNSGRVTPITNGRYKSEAGEVTFTTTHFSQFAVAYVVKTFHDLERVQWAKPQIEALASKGIINGTSSVAFSPDQPITRADYLVLLVKTLGLTADGGEAFDDVEEGTYYYEAVTIAKQLGIASGVGGNRFQPHDAISRQDLMTLTARAMAQLDKLEVSTVSTSLNSFVDRDDVADYAVRGIAALVREGLIKGMGDGRIHPQGMTSRAEAAVLLYGIYSKS